MGKRLANVNRKRCAACGECQNVCPRGAITIWKGCYATVDETSCIGCGICSRNCPANGIDIIERKGVK